MECSQLYPPRHCPWQLFDLSLAKRHASHNLTKVLTSLTLAPTSLLASLRRGSRVLGHDFLQDLSEVGVGATLRGEAGKGGELFHVGLVVGVSEWLW